jgi:osmotically-inducible protein OsmY
MESGLIERLTNALEQYAGIEAVVEVDRNAIVLSGSISSEEEREAAADIVAELAPDFDLEDNLEVQTLLPESVDEMEVSEVEVGGFRAATAGTSDGEAIEPGDFSDQPILDDPDAASGPSNTYGTPDDEISEGEEVYVPPSDPVLDERGEVLGGFATGSMDDVSVEKSSDGSMGDEAIAAAVRRELREDAATTSLDLQVTVNGGIVLLQGLVPDIEDLESAEEVAARVEGVVEVMEEVRVEMA